MPAQNSDEGHRRVSIRVPNTLYDKIAAEADQAWPDTNISAVIITRLEDSYAAEDGHEDIVTDTKDALAKISWHISTGGREFVRLIRLFRRASIMAKKDRD